MNPRTVCRTWRILPWLLPIPLFFLPVLFRTWYAHAAVSERGASSLLWAAMFVLVPLVSISLAMVVAAPLLILMNKARRPVAIGGLCGLAFLFGILAHGDATWNIYREAYRNVAVRSRPLIEAIRAYEQALGHPPPALEELKPRFVTEIPRTGLGACPEFKFIAGDEALLNYQGNPWILYINPPQDGVGFDQFFYFPVQNYPAQGYAGQPERIEDWAYVHE